MAKKVVAKLKSGTGKSHTKVIKAFKSSSGSYSFRTEMVSNEKLTEFLNKK